MDLSAPTIAKRDRSASSAAAASDTAEKKSKAGNKAPALKKDTDLGTMIAAVSRLALSNARDVAMVSSAVLVTVTFSKEKGEQLINLVKEVQRLCFQKSKESSPTERADMLSPHLYVWPECVRFLSLKCSEESKALIQEHNVQLKKRQDFLGTAAKMSTEKALLTAIGEVVKVVRMSKCYDPTKWKFQIHVEGHPEPVAKALLDYMLVHMQA
eukprot:TRINITY_DN36657_c0_g1_i1.p1 TRINITY_DN36657_c0_g1~~TRINITY_DN36657_c0_g1_i1.p1  ORF type:complete len:212 (+),score=53.92 TRINITY_DN36657_c0_g1_i1:171-806(+)